MPPGLSVHAMDVVALVLLCVTVSLVNLVFLRRLHRRVRTRRHWLRHPDVIVLVLLVLGVLAVFFGVT